MMNLFFPVSKRLLFAGFLSVAAIAAVACANGSPASPLSPQNVAQHAEPEHPILEQKQIVNPASEPSGGPNSPPVASVSQAPNGDSQSEVITEEVPAAEKTPAGAIAKPESSPPDVVIAPNQEITSTSTAIAPTVAATEPTPTVEPEAVLVRTALKSSKEVNIDFSQFRQMIPRDEIAPIYEPKFVAADQSSIPGTELVIGVELNGESRAYPVGPLNIREMVNDVVGGVPILVSW